MQATDKTLSGNIKVVLLSGKFKAGTGDIHRAICLGVERGVSQIMRQDHLFNVFRKNNLTRRPVTRENFCSLSLINIDSLLQGQVCLFLQTTTLFFVGKVNSL